MFSFERISTNTDADITIWLLWTFYKANVCCSALQGLGRVAFADVGKEQILLLEAVEPQKIVTCWVWRYGGKALE